MDDPGSSAQQTIGIIAGNGRFPVVFAKAAKARGARVVTAAFHGEAEDGLEAFSDSFRRVHLGQFKKLIRFFQDEGVSRCVMMGGVKKTRMFIDVRPDTLALKTLAKMRHTHDDFMLRTFADLLGEHGIRVESSTLLVPEILSPAGCWTKKAPSEALWREIRIGWEVAKKIGDLDIGQCVVVGGGSVLAVEAVDGTDATIKRGGGLAGEKEAVLVKVSKPNQDMRFDVPAVGIETIRTMAEARIRCLVLEAGRTVAIDREALIAEADRLGVIVLALEGLEDCGGAA